MPNEPGRFDRRDAQESPTVIIPRITPQMIEQEKAQNGTEPPAPANQLERDRAAAQAMGRGISRRADGRPGGGRTFGGAPLGPGPRTKPLRASTPPAPTPTAPQRPPRPAEPSPKPAPAPAPKAGNLDDTIELDLSMTAPALRGPEERPSAPAPAPVRPAPPAIVPRSRPPRAAGWRNPAMEEHPQAPVPERTAPPAPEAPPAAAPAAPAPAAPAAEGPARPARPTRARAEAELFQRIHDDHLWLNNPFMVRGLGLAPAVVAATGAGSAFMLCVAAALMLTLTRVLAVALCHWLGGRQRPLLYVIAAAVAYIPAYCLLYRIFGADLTVLGIYLPLLVADPVVIKRMEAPELESVGEAFRRGLNNTAGFCLALMLLGVLRELLGAGTVFGLPVLHRALLPLAGQPAGGFLLVGLLAAVWTAVGSAYVNYKREEVRRLYAGSKS